MSELPLRLKTLRIKKNITQAELANLIGVSQNAIFNWENGKREPNTENIEKLAKILCVSPAYLLGWEENKSQITLNLKDEHDIKKILEQTKERLISQEGLMFDGDPASQDAIDSILAAMQIGMEMAKKKNKEKYTPKKYKRTAEDLTKIPAYRKQPADTSPDDVLAAHEMNPTEEEKNHADEIMKDDSEWE